MSDSDLNGSAWHVPPSAYLARRTPEFELPAIPASQYVTMADGCRLAVDVYVPKPLSSDAGPGRKYPAIVLFTPYFRRFRLHDGSKAEPSPNIAKYRDFFVSRGYALVAVDVRGTGASFGTRDSFRSPREREDSHAIVDWLVAQDWSNGVVGSTGISYLGAAADFLASTGHPAVKAIAPLFAVWDTYADNYYPGGLFLDRLAETYDRLMLGLDHDRRDLLRQVAYYADPGLAGPHPVDEDRNGAMLREAVREHLGNFRMPAFITEFRFREEPLPYDPGFSSASFSPYPYASGIREDVAVYSISGWMDGAGYANGAISRFLTLPNRKRHLLLGPWDHGARVNVSPWRREVEPEFPVLAEVLRFFDEYLLGLDTGLAAEAPVHYFSVHDEAWRAAPAWPVAEAETVLHMAPGSRLDRKAGEEGAERFQADFARGTGHGTRYERIAAIDARTYHADWAERSAGLPCYTTEPLAGPMEIAGHAVAALTLAADTGDAAIHVYLSEVEADGTVRYVTEGMLRALHRKESPCPPEYRTAWPFRSFSREDAVPLIPGVAETIRIPLLPVAWCFAAGSRVRVSIAGADADHFAQVPHGRPPRLTIHHGGGAGSQIALPIRRAI